MRVARASMPLASMLGFPFAYALVLLALTLAFDRRALTNLGLIPRPRFLGLALLAGLAMYAIRTFALAALFGGTTRVHYTWPMFVFMLSSVITEERSGWPSRSSRWRSASITGFSGTCGITRRRCCSR